MGAKEKEGSRDVCIGRERCTAEKCHTYFIIQKQEYIYAGTSVFICGRGSVLQIMLFNWPLASVVP